MDIFVACCVLDTLIGNSLSCFCLTHCESFSLAMLLLSSLCAIFGSVEKSHKVKIRTKWTLVQNSLCAIFSRTKWGITNSMVGFPQVAQSVKRTKWNRTKWGLPVFVVPICLMSIVDNNNHNRKSILSLQVWVWAPLGEKNCPPSPRAKKANCPPSEIFWENFGNLGPNNNVTTWILRAKNSFFFFHTPQSSSKICPRPVPPLLLSFSENQPPPLSPHPI